MRTDPRASFVFLLVSCFGAAAASADVTYSDGFFAPSNWGFETLVAGSGGTSSASQDDGGNPGATRLVSNAVNAPNGTVFGFSRYGTTNASRYVPATMGAIATVDFRIDSIFFAGIGGQGQGLMIGAKQGQVVYQAAYTTTGDSSTAWVSHEAIGLTAADFLPLLGTAPAIDFSAAGAPIRFGFIAGSSSTTVGYENAVLYDNFEVVVRNVPSPAGLALAGLFVLAKRRGRSGS